MAEVAQLMRRHLPNILTYLRHEAVNAVIQWVKKDRHLLSLRRSESLPTHKSR
jgi:hypothetical protein